MANLIGKINRHIMNNKINKSRLAFYCNVSLHHLSMVLNGHRDLSVELFVSICIEFNWNPQKEILNFCPPK